jgi:hypothetical protein
MSTSAVQSHADDRHNKPGEREPQFNGSSTKLLQQTAQLSMI